MFRIHLHFHKIKPKTQPKRIACHCAFHLSSSGIHRNGWFYQFELQIECKRASSKPTSERSIECANDGKNWNSFALNGTVYSNVPTETRSLGLTLLCFKSYAWFLIYLFLYAFQMSNGAYAIKLWTINIIWNSISTENFDSLLWNLLRFHFKSSLIKDLRSQIWWQWFCPWMHALTFWWHFRHKNIYELNIEHSENDKDIISSLNWPITDS